MIRFVSYANWSMLKCWNREAIACFRLVGDVATRFAITSSVDLQKED